MLCPFVHPSAGQLGDLRRVVVINLSYRSSLKRRLPVSIRGPAGMGRWALNRMRDKRDTAADWIAREIVPHEAAVRRWLTRRWGHVVDTEDVIQEAYCRLAGLLSVDHIDNPGGYFQRTVHGVACDMMRRAGIINFTLMTQLEWSNVKDSEPLPDRAMEASQELERVQRLMASLSDTCRRVIELRRVDGLSRREAAEQLGVSENDVKNHLVRGLQKVMKTMAEQDARMSGDEPADVGRKAEKIGKYRSL